MFMTLETIKWCNAMIDNEKIGGIIEKTKTLFVDDAGILHLG